MPTPVPDEANVAGADEATLVRPRSRPITDTPVANTVERFAGVWILPKHIWEKFKDEKSATEYENTDLVGSGPFTLAE